MTSDDRLIYLLSMAQQTMKDYTNAALSKAGVELTMTQAGILFLLKHKDMRTMSELGEVFDIDNSAVTRLVDRLEKNGIVERQTAPGDRRAYLVHMTPKGLDSLEKAKKIIMSVNEDLRKGFTAEEVEAYKKILRSILERFKVR
ncbi:MAG TPA: MarR family transcriptional regulator [Syntrophales bacterium]|nr:MarR family transcriptional regulator [Syntrophales bacterium]HQB29939.1 MarR family transcriptional regulator [Syntrophales bacterium]HQN79009.1 MarR family transcriptional regulator [Syntrophales bacterium]HQQ26031.1 MarR family transcriptional regulator [Syntrophales bacterium]